MTPRGAPDLAICAALCLLIVASFHPVAHFDFVDFDDPDYVVDNPIVNDGLSAEGLARAFTESQSNNWHPLTWIAHMLDVSAFGMDPGAHHAVNLAIHALDAALLFLVLSAMTGARWRSAAVAALFAVHPAHVESVAWISQRKDTLSTLFWILCMGAWLGYTRRPQLGRYLLVALALAAGLCLLQYGTDSHLVLVVGWYALIQTLEGLVLTPRIMGHSVGIHPVAVIVGLLIGGDLLGFLGLIVAVPATAIIQVFVKELLESYRGSSLYSGATEPPG